MVIHINPSRVNVPSGGAGKSGSRSRDNKSPFITPKRADINHIPEPESLFTLISSAVEALRQGVRWDRGTILNILV